jgi:hypothetical protein
VSKRLAILLVASWAPGCGYFVSGTWDDDPRNWSRAFESEKPPDVVVVHSQYSRYPHWSYEFHYYFHIRANAALSRQLFTENRLVRVSAGWYRPPTAPAWFARGPMERYDIWAFADEPRRDFRVLVERKTGDLFVTDQQF